MGASSMVDSFSNGFMGGIAAFGGVMGFLAVPGALLLIVAVIMAIYGQLADRGEDEDE